MVYNRKEVKKSKIIFEIQKPYIIISNSNIKIKFSV